MTKLVLGCSLVVAMAAGACSQQDTTKNGPSEKAPMGVPNAAPAASAAAAAATEAEINPRLLRRFQVLPAVVESDTNPVSVAKTQLGRRLFYEPRLSKGKDVSCNSCHDLENYGMDNKKTSPGHNGQLGGRNSPTVYNAAASFSQFWDGRAPTIEEQAKGPIINPVEMAMPNAAAVVSTLKAIPGYIQEFERAFPGEGEPVTYDKVGRAIGAFERKLLTPGRWDKYLSGDKSALSAAEKEGLRTFLNVGCMVCHTGPLLGGSMFERVGVVEPWPNQEDRGRREVTKADGDKMMFKVPTLRNVAKTAPYFHDGSAATLEEAVRMMAKHQLGLELTPVELASIVTWLGSLTGEIPREYIVRPSAVIGHE